MKSQARCLSVSSHAWLIVSLLVIFFFIYQVTLIYSVMTMDCTPVEQLWLAERRLGFNPFTLFTLVFVLFGLWALLECVLVQVQRTAERWGDTTLCLLALVCVLAALAALRTQWEYSEVQWGQRHHKNITFALVEMPDRIKKNQWHNFLTELRCKDQDFFQKMDSEEAWYHLENLLLEQGASF